MSDSLGLLLLLLGIYAACSVVGALVGLRWETVFELATIASIVAYLVRHVRRANERASRDP